MNLEIQRKYGEAATLNFVLKDHTATVLDFVTGAVHASGDTIIMKDEGNEAVTTNGFTDEGHGYSIVLTATEMQAKRIVLYIIDQSSKIWADLAIFIETYGHASAMHAFNLDADLSGNNETWKFKQLHILNSDNASAIHAESTGGGTSARGIYAKGSSTAEGIYAEGIEGIEGRGNGGAGGQFTSAGGKGIYIAGASGEFGLHINGSNAQALRITAAGTGNAIGLDIASANNNPAVKFAGNGTAAGLQIHGGNTGNAVNVVAGSISGNGINVTTTSGHGINVQSLGGNGVLLQGDGGYAGIRVKGGLTGNGFDIEGGSTSGHGISVSTINGIGITVAGGGANPGIKTKGGATGQGFLFEGGNTSGDGYESKAVAGNGNGATFTKHGTGKDIDADELDGISLADTVDGETIEHIFELMMGMADGKFIKNFPNDRDIRFFKRNNATTLTTVHVTDTTRTRV